jgi:transcription initiation factor IIE alpha subunit
MQKIKAHEIALYGIGKYMWCLEKNEVDNYYTGKTFIAKINMVIPEQHAIVLQRLSMKAEDEQPEFYAWYKVGDETPVELYDEDEAVLLAFND